MPSNTYKPQPMTEERTDKAFQHIERAKQTGVVPDLFYYYLVDAMAEIERLQGLVGEA